MAANTGNTLKQGAYRIVKAGPKLTIWLLKAILRPVFGPFLRLRRQVADIDQDVQTLIQLSWDYVSLFRRLTVLERELEALKSSIEAREAASSATATSQFGALKADGNKARADAA